MHPLTPALALLFAAAPLTALLAQSTGESTRLLRQPSASATHIAFTYGADVWIVDRAGGVARRITSTAAVESDPRLSPDGQWIAFTSNRSGTPAVYVVSAQGGEPTRLTWYPAPALARGWSPDGQRVLYATNYGTAPSPYHRLWSVARTGGPSTQITAGWGFDGSWSPDGKHVAVDRMTRWDPEWRSYRGGQNIPLRILDVASKDEVLIPNTDRSTDLQPQFVGNKVFFISDRDWVSNVWSYDVSTKALAQITKFRDVDVKSLGAGGGQLVFEQDGYIHALDPTSGQHRRVNITVQGDFPWAATRWEDVTRSISAASLSPTGKRILLEARGEIFTVPVEQGDTRNLTRSSGAADRAPTWAPDGKQVAWFSDDGSGYKLLIANQDAVAAPRAIELGESKMAWEPAWSPDGKRLAFVDHVSRVRVVEIATGRITTADVGGAYNDRGGMGLTWSPDSRWLAYSKSYPNNFRRITAWSVESGAVIRLTDAMAHAIRPAFDKDGRHLWFLASTNLGLGSGWANTSAGMADPQYGLYVVVLRNTDSSPFPHKSDEEAAPPPPKPDTGAVQVRIDVDGIQRRIIATSLPVRRYADVQAATRGMVFVTERVENQPGVTVHKFTMADAKTDVFTRGVTRFSVSQDGKKVLMQSGQQWTVTGTEAPPAAGKGAVTVALRMQLDRQAEWRQVFDEVWHFERDLFYDPNMHGNDWNAVRERYRPLVPWIRHQSDLAYVVDLVNGELSVGHSYVSAGDLPPVDTSRVGTLGADLVLENGRWRIKRILTSESWNPGLGAPLDRPGLRVKAGDYLLAVNGQPITANDDPYRLLDGTADRQTTLLVNSRPATDSAWSITVTPGNNETALRQRAWVEDNRRAVDSLSKGRLAYAWIPNTSAPGTTSFDRYVFAQQDKQGAVIDERYNGGGSLDDYMVDHLTRTLRGAITNGVPGGTPWLLPQGVLGPKALLVNERAGSGGDYFPWAFRQQKAGVIVGTRTWGGLVSAASHYPMVNGLSVTAPVSRVFDPINNQWIAENEGVPPDIEVLMDEKSVAAGRDPQLERAVTEVLKAVDVQGVKRVTPPPQTRPSRRR
ncbi:MAG: PD40 domain-containing protein [Gemmatimonadaceae bacterium]|nr:PD40 domain-containing protein [Gemmatimonadaceae bacterium]